MAIPQRSKLLRSLRQWKTKAITRREQLEALKKRLGELTLSRDTWKARAQAHRTTMTELQASVTKLQAEVTSLHATITDSHAECRHLRTQVAGLQEDNLRTAPPPEDAKKNARLLGISIASTPFRH